MFWRFNNDNGPHWMRGLPFRGRAEAGLGNGDQPPAQVWASWGEAWFGLGAKLDLSLPYDRERGVLQACLWGLGASVGVGFDTEPLKALAKRFAPLLLRLSVHDGALWWDTCADGHHYSADPWWKAGSLQVKDWLVGDRRLQGERLICEKTVYVRATRQRSWNGEKEPLALFRFDIKEREAVWGHKRGPWQTLHRYDVVVTNASTGKVEVEATFPSNGLGAAFGKALGMLVEDEGFEMFEEPLPILRKQPEPS